MLLWGAHNPGAGRVTMMMDEQHCDHALWKESREKQPARQTDEEELPTHFEQP